MITISDGILTIPEGERFLGFTGDNLHSQKKFFIRSNTRSGWLYRLYLTFDDGRHNFFLLPSTVSEEGTWLIWDIEESHILKSGLVKAQIKAFSEEKEVYHTTSDVFVAGLSTEEDEEFKNGNTEFLLYEKTLNDLYSKMQTASAKMPYVGTNGNWFTYDISSRQYVDSGVSSLVALGDGTLPPSKLDRAYWEKNAPVSNQILDRSVLFDTVGFVNVGGSIAFLNLDLFVSTDTYTGEVTKINGFCYAMGVKFTSVETVYLINVTDGSMWKINRTNTGDEYVPVYTYDFIRQSVATADIADGAVTEDKLSHRFWHRFGSIPTVGNDSVFASMLSDDCISLIKLSTDTYANMGEGPFAGFPMGNNRYSLINLATGEIWCASKGDEGFAVTSIYTPVKVDSRLSEKSTNAVENRLVTAALNKRLKTLVSTATAADTDVIGSLTDDNYVGLVQSATSDVLSYKFESWRDPIAQTVTQYRTFLSTGVRECRTAQLTDGSYVWGEWTELEASVVKADFVYAGTFSSLNALCAYGFKENIKYLFRTGGELAGELTGNVCEGYIEPYDGNLKVTTPNNHSYYFSVDLTEKTMEYNSLIDSELSKTSSKPVQNKVITETINSINTQLGDISSALDSIIEIQNSLIGGEEA